VGYVEEKTGPSFGAMSTEERALIEHVSGRAEERSFQELPDSYGVDRVVALVRDPYWIHVYWELTEETLSPAMRRLGPAARGARVVMRVYRSRDEAPDAESVLFDIALALEARSWYVNVAVPGSTYRVDVGILTLDGKFLRLMRSNSVTTPRDRMADEFDEEWRTVCSEYEELYVLSGGLSRSGGSFELHRRLSRRLELGLASSLFSPGHWGDGEGFGPEDTG
jgi:hypothetical protein